jgi:hypothetical protein
MHFPRPAAVVKQPLIQQLFPNHGHPLSPPMGTFALWQSVHGDVRSHDQQINPDQLQGQKLAESAAAESDQASAQ